MRHGMQRSSLPSAFAPCHYRLRSFSFWSWTTLSKGLFGSLARRWRVRLPNLVSRPRELGERAWAGSLFNRSRTDRCWCTNQLLGVGRRQLSLSIRGFVALSGAACPGRSGTPATTLPRIPSMTTARAFRGFRFPAEVILWAVRWYLQFPVSYRDLERMLADRGVAVDHTTMYRWVQRFAPEMEKRMRCHLRLCRGPWHATRSQVILLRNGSPVQPAGATCRR